MDAKGQLPVMGSRTMGEGTLCQGTGQYLEILGNWVLPGLFTVVTLLCLLQLGARAVMALMQQLEFSQHLPTVVSAFAG